MFLERMKDPLQGILTFLAPILCFTLNMSLGILMKMTLSQALDTLIHLFADKEPLSSDRISVSWKRNLSRSAGGYFNCLWTGRWKDTGRTGPGVWSPSLSLETGLSDVFELSAWQRVPRGRSYLLYNQPVTHAWGIIQDTHVLIHPGTHSSLLCPQAKPAAVSTGSTGKQVGDCAAQTCSFKPG